MYCYGETVSTVGVIAKVLSYLDRTPKCEKEGDLAPERLEGKIVFQNVTLSYPSSSADKPALKVRHSESLVCLGRCLKPQTWFFPDASSVRLTGAAAGAGHSSGGSLRRWKDLLRQPPEEAVWASGGSDPAGWGAAAPLQTKILPSEGTGTPYCAVY